MTIRRLPLALDTWRAAYKQAEKLTNRWYDREDQAATAETVSSKALKMLTEEDGCWIAQGALFSAECDRLTKLLTDLPRSRRGRGT